MQLNAPNSSPAELDLAVNDLGPLAWVLDELRKSLDGAAKALKRFVRDAELARGSDLAALDASQLRIARQQLHQAVGALEMVGLGAPALVLRAMEAAVQRFVQRPEQCNQEAAAKVEQASFALTEYLEGVLADKPVSAISLFPQYRDVQGLVGADRIHPADLWMYEWRWMDPALAVTVSAGAYDDASRQSLDQLVLKIMRTGDPQAAQSFRDMCLGFAQAEPAGEPRAFWKIAAGYFEALSHGLLKVDLYVKRAASRVLLQYASFAKGGTDASDRLAQDLLFFCSQAVAIRAADTPVLSAIRASYGLARFKPVDYEAVQFGRFDPALLAQARKRIVSAKETWSSLTAGDVSKFKTVADQFSLVTDSLVKLHPPSEPLAAALSQVIEATVRSGQAPPIELALEVATAVLYLEAAFDDLDPADPQLAIRTARLAQRLDSALSGGQAQPLESWMEELYRRVSDKQTMGSVVGELRISLSELEKSLDVFFRNPQEKAALVAVPGQLSQMRGVLSVLGLDQASQAVLRMRESVEQMLVTEVDDQLARSSGTFEQLGNNLGALSFLIDMLNYQPTLAKKLFVYDDVKGELKPLMGRIHTAQDAAAAVTVNSELSQEVLSVVQDARAGDSAESLSVKLDVLATRAALADQPALAQTARDAALAVAGQGPQSNAGSLASLVEVAAPAVVPVAAATGSATGADDFEEDDLRDIFLEEAREVAGHAQAALAALATDPGDIGELTILRRAFHTLKGSSRMVGLNEFGEAAWAMEQMLNGWLAEQKPSNEEFRTLCVQAMDGFAAWIEDIASGCETPWTSSAFRASADAMREEARFSPIQQPAVQQAPAAASEASPVVQRQDVTSLPVEQGTDLDFDFVLDVEPAAPVAEAPAAPVAPALADIQGIDFDSLAALSGPVADAPIAAQAAPSEIVFEMDFADPAPAEQAEPLELSASDFDVHFLGQPAVEEEPVQTPAAQPESAALRDPDDFVFAMPEHSEIQSTAPAQEEVPTASLENPSDETASGETAGDEQIKVIGSLRIGIPLYNVYLNEADEWSRRLVTEVTEWTMERDRPIGDSTLALTHSLAGSSATVGFEALSEMARALENALQQTQIQHGQVSGRHNKLFIDAAEDIRRLLHQFAAGFLKQPDPGILQALRDIDFADEASAASMVVPSSEAAEIPVASQQPVPAAVPPAAPVPPAGVSLTGTVVPAQERSLSVTVKVIPAAPVVAAPSAVPVAPAIPAAVVAAPVAAAASFASAAFSEDMDDEIDAVDVIDPDLFPIFEEEGAELMPQLGGALRQWSARPDNHGARSEVLRALHTLKGSARLAGAMRLGEMAHRIESDIEHMGSDAAASQDFDALLTTFDAMQANFEALRHPGETAQALEPLAPLSAAAVEEAGTPATDAQDTAAASPSVPAVSAEPGSRKVMMSMAQATALQPLRPAASGSIRVRSQLLDRMVNQAGEVMITRSRLEAELNQLRGSLNDLSGNLNRLRTQLRDVEMHSETQMQSRLQQAKEAQLGFDPLEFDRFTRVQELTRMMAESVNDVATVQRTLQRTVEATEDDLIAQARQTRELQRDLLRTRMVEFEGISERLYRVVRQASKETGKQVRLDLQGGTIEMDRGMLDRMTPAFEHLLRNCVAHGIEDMQARTNAGKDPSGLITVSLQQSGNDVSVEFRDDGAGLNLERIREKAIASGLLAPGQQIGDDEAANMIFMPGFSTASHVTELSGRGIGMDVVRSEVNALGGRIETSTVAGKGTNFKLVLPLTTAVTQVVMLRAGGSSVGVPANVVETVRRISAKDLQQAYNSGVLDVAGEAVPFFWSGALLQVSRMSSEPQGKTAPVVIFRSAAQRLALHVDEVLGNQEVVVKNLGPQLSRLPGLAGMSVLASGAVVLIYNPVALASVYGQQARAWSSDSAEPHMLEQSGAGDERGLSVSSPVPVTPQIPLILVVDDSITVRRVTQRLLQREGYRVSMAADGLQALERLQEERPTVVLSDIEMPRMDGFDLARNIRGDARLSDLPIIMITSRIAEKHREHAKELGVDHYLGKPYAEDELLSLIRHYCSAEAAVS
ncbi:MULTISPECIES: Hpt domain-containing protein [unclassified Polaromonas]|jgi:chemosensory pili system protein ChpA (sensor histidine kinase/response regulator)|uniref:hybrid sensor histidine kinase/response regulator n=1 Tax=unclassified Polaromonas TaxID=2638319 RepID=UPI000BCBD5BB|nr:MULTISPECIES: Hpt domain-containing protein [unclassified Polaromonas]OYY36471.1 MAG: hybrid sensor histidine kinase/response regulator [Polaromonas sp. 35-63-35]OYZ22706.1 MAG: hybrid sensor histidine kinase/response regulator [Polaromonas sp. 16-63-31]OYZ81081.1 MAG: hybrid sensor histidine kinase/response regulator [Polaromonas sp. 24-63-21]OZA52700.1 MAG: hybrid sensor histidine kinase/response regulator [Polaromonas sp. 17-63-33]OZA88445.1 MAG: hybrid sensor histidine kinase/response r